jgi:penicillin amidase
LVERDLLTAWDGVVSKDSAAATVFEVLLHELLERAIQAKAPRSASILMGAGFAPGVADVPLYAFRRHGWLVRLLREQPTGWFEHGWPAEIAAAFRAACERLSTLHGGDPAYWAWGEIRGLELQHPLGRIPIFRKVFNSGPFAWGGDSNTVAQATNGMSDPLANPCAIANLRTQIEPGTWDEASFVLAGGQSGNPCSPHYDDLLELWKKGEGVEIPWSRDRVREKTVSRLVLEPLR